jgi:hypothetical protein
VAVCERGLDQRLRDYGPKRVVDHTGRERPIQLDEVGPHLAEQHQRGIARPDVVERHAEAGRPILVQDAHEMVRGRRHSLGFRHLEDDLLGAQPGLADRGDRAAQTERRIMDRRWREVEEQHLAHPVRRRTPDRRQARRQIELEEEVCGRSGTAVTGRGCTSARGWFQFYSTDHPAHGSRQFQIPSPVPERQRSTIRR